MMLKLSEYAELAASEFIQETDSTDLDAQWIANFFEDSGLLEDYPRQDLTAFASMVQKLLSKKATSAEQQTQLQLNRIIRFAKQRPKS